MIARNCTDIDLQKALDAVNIRYVGNIQFREIEQKGRRIRFTLRTISSKAPGHTRAHGFPGDNKPGKCLPYACWHVHGHFFEELFKINPSAGIYSSGSLANPVTGKWITKDGGNWQDRVVRHEWLDTPALMMSAACDCASTKNTSSLHQRLAKIKEILDRQKKGG